MLLTEKRIQAVREMVRRSLTDILFRCRYDIYQRMLDYVIKASDEDELYAWTLNDFPVWAAAFCDNMSGDPVVLSPWQVRANTLTDGVERVLGLCARKVGKSTFVAAKTLHRVVTNDHARKILFSPTHGQDYMFRMIRKHVDKAWFNTHYIEPFSNAMNTATLIRLGNGSEIVNRSFGISHEGRYNLGEMGDGVVIDEIQDTPKSIWTAVINPYLWDTFSRKDFIGVGTPDLRANPEFDLTWDDWNKCENCEAPYGPDDTTCSKCGSDRILATFTIDWRTAVNEGILRERDILRDMKGMTPDEVDMYLNARFPPRSGRFYDRPVLLGCVDRTPQALFFLPGSSVYPAGGLYPSPEGSFDYVMAVDWAKSRDRTEILIAEVRGGHLFYRFWRRIYPTGVEYTAQVEYVKRIFMLMRCRGIVCDATSQQDVFIEMLTKGDNAIPKARIWKDDHAAEEHYGFRGSDMSNDFMHKNHKVAMVNRMLHIPEQEPFLSEWVIQHNQLQAETTKNNLTILREPKNGYKDLAVASAMLSLFVRARPKARASMDVIPW